MFIKLNQQELESAVTEYLRTVEGIPLEGRRVDICFIANRKPPSTSAEVGIVPKGPSEASEVSEEPTFEFGSED